MRTHCHLKMLVQVWALIAMWSLWCGHGPSSSFGAAVIIWGWCGWGCWLSLKQWAVIHARRHCCMVVVVMGACCCLCIIIVNCWHCVVVVVVVITHCQFGSWWSLLFGGDGWQLLSLYDGGQSSHCCVAVLGTEKKQDRDSNRKREETDSEKAQDQERVQYLSLLLCGGNIDVGGRKESDTLEKLPILEYEQAMCWFRVGLLDL